MQPDSPRALAKDKSRAAIVAAALAEFAEHGLTAPSLDAIAARAGYTRGAFYVHFKDRDELIAAAMDDVLGTFLRALGGGAPSSLADAIRLFTSAAARGEPAVHAGTAVRFHHVLEACRASPRVGERYRGLIVAARARFTTMLDDARRAGNVRADIAAARLADVLVALGLGLVAMLELELPVSPRELGETAITLVAPPHPRDRSRRARR